MLTIINPAISFFHFLLVSHGIWPSMQKNDDIRSLARYLAKNAQGGITLYPSKIDYGAIPVGITYSVPLVLGMRVGSLCDDYIDIFLPRSDYIQIGTVLFFFFPLYLSVCFLFIFSPKLLVLLLYRSTLTLPRNKVYL